MDRVADAARWSGTKWLVLYEGDARTLGPIKELPPADMMQVGNRVQDAPQEFVEFMIKQFGAMSVRGYSTTGGTLFNARKWLRGIEEGVIGSKLWVEANRIWDSPDRNEDCCIFLSALLQNMTVAHWNEYAELSHPPHYYHGGLRPFPLGVDFSECISCLTKCQEVAGCQLCVKTLGIFPCHRRMLDAFEQCAFVEERCFCPAFVHKVKEDWCNTDFSKGLAFTKPGCLISAGSSRTLVQLFVLVFHFCSDPW